MLSTLTGQAEAVGAEADENALEEHCELHIGIDTTSIPSTHLTQAQAFRDIFS